MKGKKEAKKKVEEPPKVLEEKKEEKPFTFWDIQIDNLSHFFTEENVAGLSRGEDKRKVINELLLSHYERLGLKEEIETNELTIMADFHLYNFEFAKEKLQLPNDKVALLMNLLSMHFPSFKHLDVNKDNRVIIDASTTDESYAAFIDDKFNEFKVALLKFGLENPPESLKVFQLEELREIINYAEKSIFFHYALLLHALNHRQEVAQKTLVMYIDEPITVPPLCEARLKKPKEKESPKKEKIEKLVSVAEGKKIEVEADLKRAEKPEEEVNIDDMIKGLNLSEESRQALYSKIKELEEDAEQKLVERRQKLTEKLEEAKGKGKKKRQNDILKSIIFLNIAAKVFY